MTLDDYIKQSRKEERGKKHGGKGGKGAKGGKGGKPRSHEKKPERKSENKPAAEAKPKSTVSVKNLPLELSNKELFDLFSKFGPLKKCKLFTDDLGRSIGGGLVKFEDPAHAAKAISELHNSLQGEKNLVVEFQVKKKREEGEQKPKKDLKKKIKKPEHKKSEPRHHKKDQDRRKNSFDNRGRKRSFDNERNSRHKNKHNKNHRR